MALAVQCRLIELLVAGTPVRVAAELAGVHRSSHALLSGLFTR